MNKVAAIGVSLAFASRALASLVFGEYADATAFRTTLTGESFTESFASFKYGPAESGTYNWGGGAFAITGDADDGVFFGGHDAIDREFLTTAEDTGIRITFTAGNPTAIGGRFFGTTADDSRADASLHFIFSDGSVFDLTSSSTPANDFWGFWSASRGAVEWMRLSTSTTGAYVGIDDLTVGYAAIPEPSTYAGALGVGILIVVGIRHRRRR